MSTSVALSFDPSCYLLQDFSNFTHWRLTLLGQALFHDCDQWLRNALPAAPTHTTQTWKEFEKDMARWTEDEKSDKRARGLLMLSISSEALREEVLRAESAIQATAVVEREMNRFLERAKEKKIEREDVTDELTPPVTPESKRARTHTQVKAERTPPESAKSEEGIRVSYEDDFGIERDDVPASPRRRWSREPSPSFYEMLNNRNARSRSDSPLRTWRNETSSRLQGRAGSSSVKRKYQATVEDCDDSEPEAGL